jgi:hypothetical protein
MSRLSLSVGALVGLLFFVGCGSNNGRLPILGEAPEGRNLFWDFNGLEALGGGYVYEAWLIVDGAPVSVGRFNLDAGGTPELAGAVLSAQEVAGATAFVLTIEPGIGDDPAPAATKILGGAITGGVASLSIDHPAALGDDFGTAGGGFILETPSTASIAGDYGQGIWWLDPAAGPGASLSLPTLPAGWAYEGWVVDGGMPLSTGRFTSSTGPDGDGAGATGGPDPAPPFPGQDFISPALDLVGLTAVITVEPEPDDAATPFAFKPLVDEVIEEVGPAVVQSMSNQAGTAPTGSIELI